MTLVSYPSLKNSIKTSTVWFLFRQLLATKSLAISLFYHFFTTGWMVKEFFQGCG